MNKKIVSIFVVITIILLGVIAYLILIKPAAQTNNPISTEEKTMIETSIRKQFGVNWAGVMDGCGENSLTEMTNIARTSTGYKIDINYLCGFVVQGTKPSHATVYVSTNGQVTGVPAPRN